MAKKTDLPWFRQLEGGGLEIFLKHGPLKVRAHGSREEMFELVDWFEEKAGVKIQGDWRRPPRRGPQPIAGQQTFDIPEIAMTELESGEETPEEISA
jgi:hypothetical protein